ncbi:MAG: multicopper oxidase domain-containing protein [Rhodobacteraceae bacterium]|nr:multicopper oxidase domain-containing protein [Paracoccaceae bacterium]
MTVFNRRHFLKSSVASAVVLGGVAVYWPRTGFAQPTGGMTNVLKIPALETGHDEGGVQVYDLSLQNGITEFFEGYQTPTSGINGSYLGPTLKVRDGAAIRFNVTNDLGEPSTLHWHGMHLPARMDGGPHQVVRPGKTWASEFTVKQKAASLWYHPHLMGKTAEHVWRGMAGMVIVEDAETDALPLPTSYGIDDVPLVLQDRSLTRDGRMDYNLSMHSRMMGMVGNIPFANGTYAPYFEATTTKLRLRILNGSNASTYNLMLNDGQTFTQIATDGGFLETPVELNFLQLAPAERAEIIVDLVAGENVMLNNVTVGSSAGGMMNENNNAPAFPFLEIRPAANLTESADLPARLTTMEWLNEADAVKTRVFDLEMQMGMGRMSGGGNSHSINGKVMDMKRIDEVVNLGDTEIWVLRNVSMMPHPFHMHDVQFQILDRNGQLPAANEHGRKDVVMVNSGEVVRIIMRFEDYADPDSPFMYHCHILEHEDAGMMGQFVVVEG